MRFLALLLIIAAPGGLQVDVAGTPRKKGKEFELALDGKTKGFPDGTVMTLRFFRVVDKVSWKDRTIATVPVETPWIRKVYVEKNAFAHVEKFEAPGEVEVEFCFNPDDQEAIDLRKKMGLDYRPWSTSKRFRVARPADAAASLKQDAKDLGELLDQGRGLLKACAEIMDDAEAFKKDGPARKKEIDKLLGKLREAERRSRLTGTLGAYVTILSDVYNSLGTTLPKDESKPVRPQEGGEEHQGGTGGPTSSLTGEALTLEKAREIVEGLRLLGEREAALALLLETSSFLAEIGALRKEEPDSTKWSRVRVLLEKDLNSLRNLWTEWSRASESMVKAATRDELSLDAFLRRLDEHYASAASAIESHTADARLDESARELGESAAALEQLLRGTKP